MLVSLLNRVAEWLELNTRLALVLFTLLFLAVTGFIGATKIMTSDEIFTYYPARQATVGEVWSFFAEGLDTNTPMTAVLVHGSTELFGNTHLALRLPMIAGYWLMCICIFSFVSFRCSRLYGLAAMLLPPVTSAYFYATEARAYAVLLGVAALALVAWQRATSGGNRTVWLPILGLSLAFCISLHYFTIFLWVPLGIAEAVRIWERKKPDWPMVLTLAAALVPLAAFIPMMLLARANFLGGFWARPGLGDIEESYRFILTLAYPPMLGTAIVWLLLTRGKPATATAEDLKPRTPRAERMMIATLALTPVYVVPIMLLGGTFVARYVLFTLIGLTILLATAAYERTRGNALFALVAILCLGGWFVLKYPNMGRRLKAESHGLPFGEARPLESTRWMQAIERQPDLPLIVSPMVTFLYLQHYSLPAVHDRTYYLVSASDALRLDGADTGDRVMPLFNRRIPVKVPPYPEFIATHRKFLLLAETTNPTWVIEKLLEEGALLQLQLREGTYSLFQVSFPAP